MQMLHSAEVAILTVGCHSVRVVGLMTGVVMAVGDRGKDRTGADVFSFWGFVGCQNAEVGVRTISRSWQSSLLSRTRQKPTLYSPITPHSSCMRGFGGQGSQNYARHKRKAGSSARH